MKRDLSVVVSAILIGLVFGIFYTAQRSEIKYFETQLNLGVRGMLAWSPGESQPCENTGSNIELLLTCYLGLNSGDNRGPARVISVPVEAPEPLWERLASTFRLREARKNQIPYPHLYQITFIENQRSLTLAVRDKNPQRGASFLAEISSSIIDQQSVLIADYRQALEHYKNELLKQIAVCSRSSGNHLCWLNQDTRIVTLNIVSTAIVESRYPEIVVPIHRSSKNMTMFSFYIFSAGFIGLVTGVFIVLIRVPLSRAFIRLKSRHQANQKSSSDI